MIYSLLNSVAKQYGKNQALVFEDKAYTYGQFLDKVDTLHRELSSLVNTENQKQNNICLVSPNRPDAISLLIAIAKGTNQTTPIDYFSSPAEVREFTRLYNSQYVICHESLANKLGSEFSELQDGVRLSATDEPYILFALSDNKIGKPVKTKTPSLLKRLFGSPAVKIDDQEYHRKDDDRCIYFSSSGSSGKPKVFPLSHSQLYYQIVHVRDNFSFRPTDSVLCALHYSHNHAICLIGSVLAAGGTVHLISVEKALAPYISKYIHDNKITLFSHVPLIYKAFVDVAAHLNTDHMQSLRMAICGSAPLSGEVAKSFYRQFGKHLHQSYGLSEIGPVCVNLFEEGDHNYSSVGKIFPEIEYRIINDDGSDVVQGEEGHLLLKGKSMTNGYLSNPEANDLMFRDGWLYSQDIVIEDTNGNISIIGRRSNFINVGGLKVFPAEIERIIMNMDQVREVAVDARKDDFFGQVAEAYIVAHDGSGLTEQDVKSWCSEQLSSFKVPKSVIFMKELPKNAIGKVISSKLGDKADHNEEGS